jgi:hypothetical protein
VSSARACLCIPKPDLACDLDLLACLLDAHACLAGAAKSREGWAAGPKCPLPRGTDTFSTKAMAEASAAAEFREITGVCSSSTPDTQHRGRGATLCPASIACADRCHSCRCAGADDSTARSFLRSHNNSVEQAVEAFFQGNTEADSHGVGSRPCL